MNERSRVSTEPRMSPAATAAEHVSPNELDHTLGDLMDYNAIDFQYADEKARDTPKGYLIVYDRFHIQEFLYGDVPVQMVVRDELTEIDNGPSDGVMHSEHLRYTFERTDSTKENPSQKIVIDIDIQCSLSRPDENGKIFITIVKHGGRAQDRAKLPDGMGAKLYRQCLERVLPGIANEYGRDMNHIVVEVRDVSAVRPLTHDAWVQIFEPILKENGYVLDESLSSADEQGVWHKMYHPA